MVITNKENHCIQKLLFSPVSLPNVLLRGLCVNTGLTGENSSWLCHTRPNKSSMTFNRPWKRGFESSTSCHAVG